MAADAKATRRKRSSKSEEPRVSRLHPPSGMTLEEWQTHLRRQFGRDQPFTLVNLGDHPAFSQFQVANPQTRRTYRVTIRGTRPGENSCTCPDFATNTLGTCKHIEFTLAVLERRPKARAELKAGFQPTSGEVYVRYGSQREVCFLPPVEASAAYRRLAARYFDAEGRLLPAAAVALDEFLAAATTHDADLRIGEDVRDYLAEQRDAEERKRRVAAAFPKGIRSAAFRDVLQVPLYDYQREGVLFAARAGRCLIGDEMGLGKTAQAIAAAEVMARLFGVERVLIVCPTSLKHQWKNEITRFTHRSVRLVEGPSPKRAEVFADATPFFKVTNYDTVHMDLSAIAAWSPDLVILDEAQRIKNWSTRVARSVKSIRSPYAVVLTGTPLENRLEELISIVQYVDPHRLGPTFRLLHEHQVRDDSGRVVGYRDLDRIGQTLAPILLRRQKGQVLHQLPGRLESTIFVPMTPQQRDLHTEQRDEVARLVTKWKRFKFLTERDKQRLMIALQRMRMVCDSSYLLDDSAAHGLKPAEIATLLGEVLEEPDAKLVIFSQWTRMHELLQREAKKRKWGHVFFHGGVPGRDRGKLIEQFRNDPHCRIFLSTDAGGVGLNLQFASVVINADLPWNPAVLEQRIGRVHRLGQTQPVRVVNFVAKGTIEEGMLSVLKFKKSLFAGILDSGEANVDLGGSRLTKFMETVEAATETIPPTPASELQEAVEARREFRSQPRKSPVASEPAEDAWSNLLRAGAALLQQATAAKPGSPGSLLRTDEATGETYLRLPVPPAPVVQELLGVLSKLLGGGK